LSSDPLSSLSGKRIALVGKLASMSQREAAELLRARGAVVVEKLDATVQLAVLGEQDFPLPAAATGSAAELFAEPARQAMERGSLRVISETQLWQELGLVEQVGEVRRLYTPAMLAKLLGVEVAVVRRWHRRGLIVPVHVVRRLPYFDFQEVATARRLAELLAAGVSPRQIEKQLTALARWLPGVQRPLAQLSVIVRDRKLLLRHGEGLVEAGGQYHFDFEGEAPEAVAPVVVVPASPPAPQGRAAPAPPATPVTPKARETIPLPTSPEQLRALAAELEDDGQLAAAAEMYRAAMAAGGATAELCFQLAEVLYRLGDLTAARERYYMAIELDEEYIEARANLGCVLAETGQLELAAAAFEGALRFHPEYADAHYQLARTLDELGQQRRAEEHWRAFLELATDSPWADEARARLAQAPLSLFP
jgi:tetratricopeptide (TPR) repeat protein